MSKLLNLSPRQLKHIREQVAKNWEMSGLIELTNPNEIKRLEYKVNLNIEEGKILQASKYLKRLMEAMTRRIKTKHCE